MNIVLILEPIDIKYSYRFRELLSKHNMKIYAKKISITAIIRDWCKAHKTTKCICTNLTVLKRLIQTNDSNINVDKIESTIDYRGSIFKLDNIEILILPPPKLLVFQPELKWLIPRWVQKLTNPLFPQFPELDWFNLTHENIDAFLFKAKKAILIGVDIETKRMAVSPDFIYHNKEICKGIWTMGTVKKKSKKLVPIAPIITMVAYSCLFQNEAGEFYAETGVLKITSMVEIGYMKELNLTPAPKVMQNGGYDSTYFIRYQAPLYNYVFDTFIMMHSWLVELPRNLSFIASLFNKYSMYWKDEAEFNMPQYNAKDAYNTLFSWIFMLDQMPEYALRNYEENFRMQFPCITCGLDGFLIDKEEQLKLKEEREYKNECIKDRLGKIVNEGFNPNSPKQTLTLMRGVGYRLAKNSNEKTVNTWRNKHPLWDFLGELIQDYRKNLKAVSTYFNMTLLDGRFLYELNPGATDTGRLASKASNLWCGTQVQNIPLYSKSMILADNGWVINSCDNKQSESRTTAYISEDSNLIKAVEADGDFHQYNGAMFFGLPPEAIVGSEPGDLRWITKKINHGANYNMGDKTLLDTMTLRHVLSAKKLLKLPVRYTPLKVCKYLLECFDTAYPDIRGKYYEEVVREIQLTGFLVGATGWTRKCFGNPTDNKPTLNSYIAHPPQSLSVKLINSAFFDCWLELQINRNIIRMKAQIHDDIIWQCRLNKVKETSEFISKRLAQPIEIKGRTLLIPNDLSLRGKTWKDLKE